MKNKVCYFNFLIGILLAFTFSSCDSLLDPTETDFGNGPDFVGFSKSNVTVAFATDGTVNTYTSNIHLFGPGLNNFTGEVTVTYGVDDAETNAEEGVHYTINSNTVTLNSANDYSADLTVDILTEGIEAPIEKALVLKISDISTTATTPLVISDTGQASNINISYICFADLSGSYTMTNDVCNPTVEGVTITANAEGGWDLSIADGGLLAHCTSNTSLEQAGSIIVVCGEVTPNDTFAFCGSNGIGCITGGTWNPETGTLILNNNDSFFGVGGYISTYVRTSN